MELSVDVEQLRTDVRQQIANELHDGVVQSLAALLIGIGMARRRATGAEKATLEAFETELAEAIASLRTLMNDLEAPVSTT